MASAKEK